MKNIGLIGCGNIAETYFKSQDYFNNIKFVACADINQVSADECAEQNNILSMSVDDLHNVLWVLLSLRQYQYPHYLEDHQLTLIKYYFALHIHLQKLD